MNLEETCKTIIKLRKKVLNTLEFNLKVEAKREYDNFLKENRITVKASEPFYYYFQNESEICIIGNRYAKRKINLDYKHIGYFLKITDSEKTINF